MKTYKVELSFLSKTYYVSAENETDAMNIANQEHESEMYHKADDVEVFDTPIIKVKYCGSDDFFRPVFKDVDRHEYYGSTDILLSNYEFKKYGREKISENDLCYFGQHFGCEPMGTHPAGTIEIIWRE
jgi:hypothetical protein